VHCHDRLTLPCAWQLCSRRGCPRVHPRFKHNRSSSRGPNSKPAHHAAHSRFGLSAGWPRVAPRHAMPMACRVCCPPIERYGQLFFPWLAPRYARGRDARPSSSKCPAAARALGCSCRPARPPLPSVNRS
jgi:hypothetical protein